MTSGWIREKATWCAGDHHVENWKQKLGVNRCFVLFVLVCVIVAVVGFEVSSLAPKSILFPQHCGVWWKAGSRSSLLNQSNWAACSIGLMKQGSWFCLSPKLCLSCEVPLPWSIPWAAVIHVPLDMMGVSPDRPERLATAPTPSPGKQLGGQGLLKAEQGELLCLKGSAQSFQCSVEKSELKAETCSCNISQASLSCQRTRGQNLVGKLKAVGPWQWPTWTYGKHFFPSLLNLSWELRLWEKNRHLLSDRHARALTSLQPHQDFGHYDPIFMGLKRKRNLAKFSKSPNIPTARPPGWNANPVCLAWSPRVV